MTDSTEMIK